MDFPLVPWRPDEGETMATVVADNVLPQKNGYGPMKSLYVPSTATALPAAPKGLISVVLDSGVWRSYAFTTDSIYQLQSDYTWGSAVATGYACPQAYNWSAVHFGKYLLYTNTTDGLYQYNVEAGGSPTAITDAGNPAWIFAIENFIVALNCLDSTGARNNRLIRTSLINDQTNWVGGDYQALADGGELLAGFDLNDGMALILQQRALALMNFHSNPGGAVFGLEKIADGKGTVSAQSCVSFDGVVFYLSTDGFYKFSLGEGNVPIGAEKVNRWFLELVDQSYFELVQGSVDPLNKMVWWRFKRADDASTTVSEVLLGYDWQLNEFVTATEQTAYLSYLASVGVTWDAASGTWDAQTLTWDDRALLGSEPLFAALDESYKFGLFTGDNAAATLTTFVGNSPSTGLVEWATPITDAVSPTLELGVKDVLSSAITWKTAASKQASGRVPLRGRGKNLQFRLNIPAGAVWSYARGIDHVVAKQGGPR